MADTEQWFKAVRSKNAQLVSELLPTFARTQNKQGETALMIAAASNSLNLCRALAPHEHSMVNNRGYTALALAALRNHSSVCLLLVKYEKGVPLHKGLTPLLLAIQSSSLDAVRVLTPYYPDTDASKMSDIAVLTDDSDMLSLLVSSTSVTQEDIQRSLSNSASYTERIIKNSIEHNVPMSVQSLLLSTTLPTQSEAELSSSIVDKSGRAFSLGTHIGATVASTRIEQSTVPCIGRSISTDPAQIRAQAKSAISTQSALLNTAEPPSGHESQLSQSLHSSHLITKDKPEPSQQVTHSISPTSSQSARSTGVILPRTRVTASPSSQKDSSIAPNVSLVNTEIDMVESRSLKSSKGLTDSAKKKRKRPSSSANSPTVTTKIDVQRLFPSPPRGHPGHSPSRVSSRCPSRSLSQGPGSSPTHSSLGKSSPLRKSSKKLFATTTGHSGMSSPKVGNQFGSSSTLDIRSITVKNPFSNQQKVDPAFYIGSTEDTIRSLSTALETPTSRRNAERYKHRYTVLAEKYSKMQREFNTLRQMGEKVTANVVNNLNEVIATLQVENEEKTAEIDRLQVENEELLWKLDEAEQILQKTIQLSKTDAANTDVVFPPNWEATDPSATAQSGVLALIPRSISAPRSHTDSKLNQQEISGAELDNILRHLHTQSNLSRAAQIILALKGKQHELELEQSILKKKLEAAIDARDAEHNEVLILRQKLMVLEKDYLDLKAVSGIKIQKDSDGNTRLIRAVAFKTCSHIKALKQLIKEEAGVENNRGQTALMYAAALGVEDVGLMLISKESGHQDKFGCSALMIAVKQGLIGLSEALIHYEAGLRDHNGETALMILTRTGILESMYAAMDTQLVSEHAEHRLPSHLYLEHVDKLTGIIRTLIEIEGGMRNNDGKTALMIAVECKKNKILVELIAKEAKLHDTHYRTALMIACEVDNIEAVHLLVPHEKCILRSSITPLDHDLVEGDFDMLAQSIHAEEAAKANTMYGTTSLMQMAYSGNYALVQILKLHESGMVDRNGLMALDYAVLAGHYSIVELLKETEGVENPAIELQSTTHNLHDSSQNYRTPLMQIVKQRRPGLTYCLLNYAGQQDKQGMTALMYSVLARNHDSIRLLINKEKRMQNAKGETALMLAILIEDKIAIELLEPHEQGIQDNDGTTALMICAYNNYKELVSKFIEKEHGLVMIDGTSALMVAAEQGFAEICAALRPYELNLAKDDGTTAFLLAKKNGHFQIAESLSPEVQVDKNGNTDLMRQIIELGIFDPPDGLNKSDLQRSIEGASNAPQYDTMKNVEKVNKTWMLKTLLYQAKQTNCQGKTALMLAVENRNFIAVKLLRKLEAKMTVDSFVYRTWKLTNVTALMMAACYGYTEIVSLLARYESRCVESSFHRTALMAAAYFNRKECVEILLDYEAGMQRREGSTALMLAVTSGYYDIAAILVQAEANITTNAKSTYGEGASALIMAASLNNYQMVELLAPYEAISFGRTAIFRTSDPAIVKLIKMHCPLGQDGVGAVS